MRTITVQYQGDCRQCGANLSPGAQAVYEHRVGIFCPTCAPTAPEDIRAYRQQGADKRADRLQGWADARRQRALATFEHNRIYTGDHAFNTQPGHIPLRARVIAQENRAFESLQVAERLENKAASVRRGRVAGAAARDDEAHREALRAALTPGMTVHTDHYGDGVLKRVYTKSARVTVTRNNLASDVTVDLIFVSKVKETEQ